MLHQLERVEKLANAGKVGRLLHDPLRYMNTMAFTKFIYPRTHKGVFKKARTFFGHDMQVLLPAATDIYLTGGKTHSSEIRLARYMINELKPGSVYMDVGAHFGYFTLLAAALVGTQGKVYAFEAANNTFAILKKNIAASGHIEATHRAVSDREELIAFYEFPVLYSEYNSMNVAQFREEEWISKYRPQRTEVQATTLDIFTQAVGAQVDVIKIDVEGAEDKVMQGATRLLAEQSPVIIMEFLPQQRHNAAHTKAASILQEKEYRPHAIDTRGKLKKLEDIEQYLIAVNADSDNIVFVKNN